MQTENRLFDDLARVASGAINTLGGLREEIELRVKERLERLAAEMDLVSREEFDAVKAMAAKARAEQETLSQRIEELEKRLAATAGPAGKRAPAKAATGKAAAGKSRTSAAKAGEAKGAKSEGAGSHGTAADTGEGGQPGAAGESSS